MLPVCLHANSYLHKITIIRLWFSWAKMADFKWNCFKWFKWNSGNCYWKK